MESFKEHFKKFFTVMKFDEDKHPRDSSGRFSSGSGESSAGSAKVGKDKAWSRSSSTPPKVKLVDSYFKGKKFVNSNDEAKKILTYLKETHPKLDEAVIEQTGGKYKLTDFARGNSFNITTREEDKGVMNFNLFKYPRDEGAGTRYVVNFTMDTKTGSITKPRIQQDWRSEG